MTSSDVEISDNAIDNRWLGGHKTSKAKIEARNYFVLWLFCTLVIFVVSSTNTKAMIPATLDLGVCQLDPVVSALPIW